MYVKLQFDAPQPKEFISSAGDKLKFGPYSPGLKR